MSLEALVNILLPILMSVNHCCWSSFCLALPVPFWGHSSSKESFITASWLQCDFSDQVVLVVPVSVIFRLSLHVKRFMPKRELQSRIIRLICVLIQGKFLSKALKKWQMWQYCRPHLYKVIFIYLPSDLCLYHWCWIYPCLLPCLEFSASFKFCQTLCPFLSKVWNIRDY